VVRTSHGVAHGRGEAAAYAAKPQATRVTRRSRGLASPRRSRARHSRVMSRQSRARQSRV